MAQKKEIKQVLIIDKHLDKRITNESKKCERGEGGGSYQ